MLNKGVLYWCFCKKRDIYKINIYHGDISLCILTMVKSLSDLSDWLFCVELQNTNTDTENECLSSYKFI